MFLLLAVTAAVFYSLNSVFTAPLGRTMSPLAVAGWRGVSLGATMLPLLWFVPVESFSAFTPVLELLMLGACVTAAIGNVSIYYGLRYLPVGIGIALSFAFAALMSTAIGVVVLKESLSRGQVAFGLAIIGLALALGYVSSRSKFENLNVKLGVLYCIGFGVFLGIGYGLVGYISKTVHPVIVGYLWELGAGAVVLVGLAVVNLREAKVTPLKFGVIAVAASPTVVGTSCYAIATTLGPLGVLGAVLSTMGAFSALFSYLFLREKLSKAQWLLIALVVCALAGLKLASGGGDSP